MEDPLAQHVQWEISTSLGVAIKNLRVVSVFTVYSDLAEEILERFVKDVLHDPVLSVYSIDSPIAERLFPFTWALEVSYKPGVTDNVGHTAQDVLGMLLDFLGIKQRGSHRIYKSTQHLIHADLDIREVRRIAREVLYNELIEDIDILSFEEFRAKDGFAAKERGFRDTHIPLVKSFDLKIDDEALAALSRERVLALSLEEMKYFRSYFERDDVKEKRKALGMPANPTDVELESFAQTQSEHCKHKIFNATIIYREGEKEERIDSLFQTYIKAATSEIANEKDYLVSVFKDNAGVIRFNNDYNLTFKVETHNSPSALDPYGGSITGIVGCDRDPAGTGLGSRIIAHTDVLCFGDPGYSGDLPPRMMHPKRIMEGVIKGIEDGGNKCGIPTVNGAVIFDHSYSGKPLVFCGSVGIMPRKIKGRLTHEKAARPGDVIVMVGGKIGKDGIHGATFSSEEIKETSPVQAVQIGDPITQKKMLDMLIEARDLLLYRGITDNGAGGLSSSVGEMALLSGGACLELEKAPLKYPGLDPWEILLSEAQERMTVAVPRENLDAFCSLAERRDVLALPIGHFTDTGFFHVTYNKKSVCFLHLEFLHSTIPLTLEAEWEAPNIEESAPCPDKPMDEILLDMISDLNSCSREPLIRRYDHEVGGCTIVKPLVGTNETGPSDGGVIAPVPADSTGFVLANGINPFYSRGDAYHMAALAVDEALRNAVVVGADPERVALLDNFCWPDPVYDPEKTADGKYKLAQLVRAAKGLYDTAVAYKTPFISGKDSMKNDYKIENHKVSVLPTILISSVGIVPDMRKCVTSDFKQENDTIYLLGRTKRELGQSLYYRKYGGSSRSIPSVDPSLNMKLYKAYFRALERNLLASGHDVSEGGLVLSVIESCIAGDMGAVVDLSLLAQAALLSDEDILFSESPGRIVLSVHPEHEEELLRVLEEVPVIRIGSVKESGRFLLLGSRRNVLADLRVKEIIEAYRRPLFRVLGMRE